MDDSSDDGASYAEGGYDLVPCAFCGTAHWKGKNGWMCVKCHRDGCERCTTYKGKWDDDYEEWFCPACM